MIVCLPELVRETRELVREIQKVVRETRELVRELKASAFFLFKKGYKSNNNKNKSLFFITLNKNKDLNIFD